MKNSFAVSLLLMVTLGCNSKKQLCEFDQESFGEVKAPFLRKLESAIDNPCKFRGDFWIDSTYYYLTGAITRGDDAIRLDFDSIVTTPVNYFDFKTREGDTYPVIFQFTGHAARQSVRLENIFEPVAGNGKNRVYQFRVMDGYIFEDELFDVVFFVTMEKAVIGSLVSKFYDGKEWIMIPGGNILRDRIDYSQKQFGELL